MYTSGLVDNIMFSRNGTNGPESKTTSMFRRFRQVAAPAAKLPSTTVGFFIYNIVNTTTATNSNMS